MSLNAEALAGATDTGGPYAAIVVLGLLLPLS